MLPISPSSLLLPTLSLLTAFTGLFLAVLAAYRPPRWLKPRWLQEKRGPRAMSSPFPRLIACSWWGWSLHRSAPSYFSPRWSFERPDGSND